jgi:hypothetical protein
LTALHALCAEYRDNFNSHYSTWLGHFYNFSEYYNEFCSYFAYVNWTYTAEEEYEQLIEQKPFLPEENYTVCYENWLEYYENWSSYYQNLTESVSINMTIMVGGTEIDLTREIGFVLVDPNGNASACAWGTSNITITVLKHLGDDKCMVLEISAPRSSNYYNKSIRIILPPRLLDPSRIEILFDNTPLSEDYINITLSAGSLMIIINIPYFSTHLITLRERSLVPEEQIERMITITTVFAIVAGVGVVALAVGNLFRAWRPRSPKY